MLTIEYQKVLHYDPDGNPIYLILGFGLSSDTKPTQRIGNGSAIMEMDTSKVYFYDQAGESWREWGADESASTLSASFAASPKLSSAVQPISLDRPNLTTQITETEVNEPEADEEVAEESDQEAVNEDA